MLKGIVASLLVTVLTAAPVLAARSGSGKAARAAGGARALNPTRGAKGFSGSHKSSLGSVGASRAQLKLGPPNSLLTPPKGASARLGQVPPLSAPSSRIGATPNLEKSTGAPH